MQSEIEVLKKDKVATSTIGMADEIEILKRFS